MKKLDSIKMYRGTTSEVVFDFTDFLIGNGVLELNIIETKSGNIIYTKQFNEALRYVIQFTPEFTESLEVGNFNYHFDITWIKGENEKFIQCLPSNIYVYGTAIGGGIDANEQK